MSRPRYIRIVFSNKAQLFFFFFFTKEKYRARKERLGGRRNFSLLENAIFIRIFIYIKKCGLCFPQGDKFLDVVNFFNKFFLSRERSVSIYRCNDASAKSIATFRDYILNDKEKRKTEKKDFPEKGMF